MSCFNGSALMTVSRFILLQELHRAATEINFKSRKKTSLIVNSIWLKVFSCSDKISKLLHN